MAALAALGLFGLLSYTVVSRRREIGIRMAVGASGGAIVLWVCRSGVSLMIGSVALGCAGALAASRLIASQLCGVVLGDSVTWLVVLGVVSLPGLLACALAAWRATRLDPVKSLGCDESGLAGPAPGAGRPLRSSRGQRTARTAANRPYAVQ